MTIKIKYHVEANEANVFAVPKSFDTLDEAKEYEAVLALVEIICDCLTVYVSPTDATALAAHIIKGMKRADEATHAVAANNDLIAEMRQEERDLI